MKNKNNLPQICERILSSCRSRSRNQTFLTGLLLLLCIVLLLPLAEFFLDFNLDLPPVVRAVLIIFAAVVFLRAVYVWIFRPFKRQPGRDQLARMVEKHNPGLKGVFITAVQLSNPGNPAARHVSPALIDEVRKEAADMVPHVNISRIFPLQKLFYSTLIFCGLCLIWIMLVSWKGDVLGVWRSRLLLNNMPWPRSVDLFIEKPPGSSILLAHGDDLMVQVKVLRGKVRQVELVCDWKGAPTTNTVMTKWGEDVFRHTLPNLARPFSFYAVGGDGKSSKVSVNLAVRPRIERIRAKVKYPAYTGKEAETSEDGSVKALTGSRLSFRAWVRPQVVSVEMDLFSSGSKEPYENSNIEVKRDKEFSLLTGGFEITRSGYYTFKLEGKNGFKNIEASRFRIRAVPDQVPRIRVEWPPPKEECTRVANVAVKGEITDDWSVESGVIKYRVKFDPEKDQDPGLEQSLPLPLDKKGKKVPIDYLLRLAEIKLKEGSTILWRIEAGDMAGGKGHSSEQVLVIVSPEDLKKILFDRLNMVRENIRSLKELQARSRKRTRDLIRKVQDRASLDSSAAAELRQVRSDERALSNRLSGSAVRLYRIQERMIRNYVGDIKDRRWIKLLGDEVKGLVEERVEPLVKEIKSLVEAVSTGSVSPVKLTPVLSEQGEIEKQLSDIVDRMTQFGDINLLIRRLKDILSNEKEIKALTKDLLNK